MEMQATDARARSWKLDNLKFIQIGGHPAPNLTCGKSVSEISQDLLVWAEGVKMAAKDAVDIKNIMPVVKVVVSPWPCIEGAVYLSDEQCRIVGDLVRYDLSQCCWVQGCLHRHLVSEPCKATLSARVLPYMSVTTAIAGC